PRQGDPRRLAELSDEVREGHAGRVPPGPAGHGARALSGGGGITRTLSGSEWIFARTVRRMRSGGEERARTRRFLQRPITLPLPACGGRTIDGRHDGQGHGLSRIRPAGAEISARRRAHSAFSRVYAS